MPYLIAIAVLIVAGIGFTLFQSNDSTVTPPVTETEITREVTNEEVITNNTPATEASNTTTAPATENTPAPTNTAVTPAPTPTKPVETPAPAVAYDYKNGTYTSKITYNVPDHKTYTMDVTITLENDKVTASNIVYSSNANGDGNTKKFNNAYSSQVIGKDIDSISLSRVGGASLTTKAFNNAVEAVKADAKS